jgi:polyketide cyclase/dehydrase/lipid transport protein
MLKIIALVVIVLIAAVLIYAATKPDMFRVQRSTSIKAAADTIFPLINDFQKWGAWSPYEKLDPAMKRTYSGSSSGKGAVYEWNGNSKAGEGRMEIVDTSPPSRVSLSLDFTRPFEAHNFVDFTLEPAGDTTNVTWAMHGPSPYIAKVMHIFFDMDSMVGKDFETGLANLKAIAEK